VARAWLARWMPRTRLLVLVRNPSQRAYSHVNMGKEWMASKCTRLEERARMEPIQDLLTFDALMERSLIQTHWKSCADRRAGIATPSSFKWLRMSEGEIHAVKAYRTLHPLAEEAATEERLEAVGQVVRPLPASGAAMWDCLREHDASLARKHERELLGEWPSVSERPAIDGGVQLLGHCSEMMLFPPGALAKGATYAEELEKWASVFDRSQLKVLHTDELADPRSAQRLMDETFAFLGLPAVPIGNETRMCVHGKAGVMDVLNAFEGSVRIGTKDVAPELLNVGTCDKPPKGMHREPRYGALHHDIEPALLRRLRAYYEPSNQRLYRFLGTDLGW